MTAAARPSDRREVSRATCRATYGPRDAATSAPRPRRTPCRAALGPAALIAALLGAAVAAGCAGYQIGNASLYPTHIRTVYVPVFSSESFRPHLGERLTEAVVKRIEEVTPYKVVGSPAGADSTLSGRIVGETKQVLIPGRTGDPRELQTSLVVVVSWVDHRGQTIRQSSVSVPPQLVDVTGVGGLVPEVGQSVSTSHQQAIAKLADQVVALMEAPW